MPSTEKGGVVKIWFLLVSLLTFSASHTTVQSAISERLEKMAEEYGEWLGMAYVCDLPAKKIHQFDEDIWERMSKETTTLLQFQTMKNIYRESSELAIFYYRKDPDTCAEVEGILDRDPPWAGR